MLVNSLFFCNAQANTRRKSMDNMSSTTATAPFSVGSILGRTWTTMTRNPAAYLGLTFVVGLVALLINIGLNIASPRWGSMLGSIVSMVLNLMAGGAIVYVAFEDLRGVRVGLKEGLTCAINRLAPLFLAALVIGLGIGIGMILLIVPGLILACAWVAAIPACMVEKLSPLDCIRRSMALTKGYRWTIFGAVTVIGLAMIALGFVSGLLGLALFSALTSSPYLTLFFFALLYLVLTLVPSTLFSLLTAVMYADLRNVKEGISKESLAEVFD